MLESPSLNKGTWQRPVKAPSAGFTFELARDEDPPPADPRKRWVPHDPDSLELDVQLERTLPDGRVQDYRRDNDTCYQLTYEQVMDTRPGRQRKWQMDSGGIGPAAVRFEVKLLAGDKAISVRVIEAVLVFWAGDAGSHGEFSPWEDGWDGLDADEECGEDDYEDY